MSRWWPFNSATLSTLNKLTSPIAPVEHVSDEESTGGSIPYDSAKPNDIGGGDDKKEEEEREEEDEEEDVEEGEGFFVVEKILGHEFVKNGKLLLHVKWKGYDDPEDETMEPEENLEEGARDLLDEYYQSQGGRPEPPRKRKSNGASKATSSKAEPKKRRKSKGPSETDGQDKDMPGWLSETKSWEKDVKEVDTVMRDEGSSTLFAYLHWTNGKKSKVSIETCYEKCPMKMLKFYEQHLVFKDN